MTDVVSRDVRDRAAAARLSLLAGVRQWSVPTEGFCSLERPTPVPDRWGHRPSHLDLIGGLPRSSETPALRGPAADLGVVPTSRPAPATRPGVRLAIDLARKSQVGRLLFLVSKEAATAEAVTELEALLRFELHGEVAFEIVRFDRKTAELPLFAVDRMCLTSAYRRFAGGQGRQPKINDVGAKRNLAILQARRSGEETVLFLDDDVSPLDDGPAATLDASSLVAARAALDSGASAVSWLLRGYDDNSVVCRAAALIGVDQQQFIGAGALFVRVDERTPFFPAIYNEDWLFLLAMLSGSRAPAVALRCAGSVRQDPYPGYVPSRARAEELGDLLGESLMTFLHRGEDCVPRDIPPAFWREAFARRETMITEIRAALDRQLARHDPTDVRHAEYRQARDAMDAALVVHRQIGSRPRFWVDQCVRYVENWFGDRRTWARVMADPSSVHRVAPAGREGLVLP
jgi:hypothetical protein